MQAAVRHVNLYFPSIPTIALGLSLDYGKTMTSPISKLSVLVSPSMAELHNTPQGARFSTSVLGGS